MSRLAQQQPQPEEPRSAPLPPAEAFSTTLLAIMGRRRVVALLSEADAERADLLLRLGRHMEAEGALVMRAVARPEDTVETLVEAGARDILDRRTATADFDAVVDAVADRLELAGTGLLIVDEAHRLTEDALYDLHELAASVSPSGRFLQVLLAGRPPLADRLATGSAGVRAAVEIHMAMPGLHADPVPAVPRHLTAGPTTPAAGDRRLPPARPPQPERWLAAVILVGLLGGAAALVGWPSLRDAGLQIWGETARSLGLRAEAPPAPQPPPPPTATERLVQPPPAIAPAPIVAPPAASAPQPAPAPAPMEAQPAPRTPETPAALPAPRPEPPPAAAGSSGTATQAALRTISSLTARAQRQIENNRLTTPAGDNALETVAALERTAAAAPQVDEIRDAIVVSYLRLGKQAEQRDQLAIARTYYRRGLQARPGHPALSQRLRALLRNEEAPRPDALSETPELPPGPFPDDTPTLR